MPNTDAVNEVELVITPRERDLGGFFVRRVLPCAKHKMVGPFIFFDHMGPANFEPGHGVDVRPHPHINLATVTYLFDGKIRHRDNLGSDQLIEPGAINWMTAGRGIVHSERTPDELKQKGSAIEGIQCWVALPESDEDTSPSFYHYPVSVLPEFKVGDVQLKLLLGKAFGHQSPVIVHSDLLYLDVHLPKDSTLSIPCEKRELAAYIVNGTIKIAQETIQQCNMAIVKKGVKIVIEALAPTRLMLLGGMPLGERFIYWNFVSSAKDKILKAMSDWSTGPGGKDARFSKIPGDDEEFISLPDEPNPKGTIM